VANVADGEGLVDGALDAGAEGVGGLPGCRVLGGAGLELGIVDLAGMHGELTASLPGGGALLAYGAGSAGGCGEADHNGVSASLGDRVP